MVSEAFKFAVWKYRAQGGRLYRLALEHGLTPSMLSAALSGARRVNDDDERIIHIGQSLGLTAEECFAPTHEGVAS
jgi:hypothetical protein